jgi:PhnB protein
MEFYRSVFGGELRIGTFKEFHALEDPSEDDKIMHAELEISKGLILMGADTPNRMNYQVPAGFDLALSGDSEKEITGYFNLLSSGGSVTMPLAKAPWGDTFGMCSDQFGITWMVNITAAK